LTLIGRYLAREIFGAVAFVLAAFLALFTFFDFINELEDIGRGGYRVQHALAFVALNIPGHVYELMPIAALIGSIFALAQFAAHSEYTAMRAAGLGRRRALAAVASVGAVVALVTVLFGELLTPPAERLAQQVRLGASRRRPWARSSAPACGSRTRSRTPRAGRSGCASSTLPR